MYISYGTSGRCKETQKVPPFQLEEAGESWKGLEWNAAGGASGEVNPEQVPWKKCWRATGPPGIPKFLQQSSKNLSKIRLTWEKFQKLYADLLTYCMVDDERLRLETLEVIARDVFKKAPAFFNEGGQLLNHNLADTWNPGSMVSWCLFWHGILGILAAIPEKASSFRRLYSTTSLNSTRISAQNWMPQHVGKLGVVSLAHGIIYIIHEKVTVSIRFPYTVC